MISSALARDIDLEFTYIPSSTPRLEARETGDERPEFVGDDERPPSEWSRLIVAACLAIRIKAQSGHLEFMDRLPFSKHRTCQRTWEER